MPHDHGHIGPEAGDRRVAWAVGVNLGLTAVQIAGGLVSGSMALIADAVHNLSDAMSLVIAFVARKIARRPADDTMTFGYDRAEVVAALVNYTVLVVIALFLLWEGVSRLVDPPEIDGWVVVLVAAAALLVDLVTVALTYRMSKTSMNIRAAFLHNLADAMSSVAVIVAGMLVLLYDWRLVDPLATLGIAGYILWHAVREIRPVVRLLMLGSPDTIDNAEVARRLAEVDGVEGVHHLHLWQIDERRVSLEAHVAVPEARLAEAPAILDRLKRMLSEEFGIGHSTIEVEATGKGCAGARYAGGGPQSVS